MKVKHPHKKASQQFKYRKVVGEWSYYTAYSIRAMLKRSCTIIIEGQFDFSKVTLANTLNSQSQSERLSFIISLISIYLFRFYNHLRSIRISSIT